MIALEADLRAESAGLRMRINGRGNVLTCRLDGNGPNVVEALRRSLALLPALRAVMPMLVKAGIRLELVVGNVRLAQAGSGVHQNALARLLRLPFVHVGK